ncbi:MAG: ATP-binding protein [Desulfosarcinaceae bacterium]|jgi:two-component system NtrC family sensor kinase
MTKAPIYRSLRRRIVAITLVVSIAPLLTLGAVIYHQYIKVFEARIEDQIRHLARSQANAVDVFLNDRTTLLAVLVATRSFEELGDQRRLDALFDVITRSADGLGLVDLGVIAADGCQVAYAGPFALIGLDYSREAWFRETMSRGSHISDVFTGYRQLPHFIIAIRGHSVQGPWIMRATIDSQVFNRLVRSVRVGESGDAYIINPEGFLQTEARLAGQVLDRSALAPQRFGEEATVLRQPMGNGATRYVAGAWLKSKDWLLIVSQDSADQINSLYRTRDAEIIIILLGCLAIVIATVITTRTIVSRLQHADRDLNALNAQLLQRDKMAALGKMAAGIAHEINNPLAVIGEKAGWIRDLLDDPALQDSAVLPELMTSVDKIESHVERARKITHRMLGFARRMEPRLDDVDVNRVLGETVELLQNHARVNDIRIDLDLADDLPIIASDQSQLQQVFLNLLNNAIDAIGKDGVITGTTRRAGKEIHITITDNGPGIPPEHLARVFDPFFTTKDPGQGTGLGLAISFQIIEKMGGRLLLENVTPRGSRATVILPVVIPEPK